MATLSIQDIWTLLIKNGASGDQALIGTAVVLAESGGKTDAINVVGGSGPAKGSKDRGIWQINSYWHKDVSDADAFDPVKATVHAKRISSNWTNWTPWSVYTSGSWKSKADDVLKANPKSDGTTALVPGGGLSNVTDVLKAGGVDVPGLPAIDLLGATVRMVTNVEFWKRAGIAALGVGLLIVGIMAFQGVDVKDVQSGAMLAATKGGSAAA